MNFSTIAVKNIKSPQPDGYNILFIFTDQERYFRQLPEGVTLPAHERLQQTGITFHNHYTSAVMCTSSRSVLLTGLSTPVNGMFENTNAPYVPNLSTDIPTYGHLLRKSGYYTAYKGKWHLNRKFDSTNKPVNTVRNPDGGVRKVIKQATLPNMKKRGSLRTVFDGRYKFTRYFSPTEHNQPSNLEDLYAKNDLELFDLVEDPQEMKNLAGKKDENADLVLSMSQKLEQRIQAEIGKDDGSELPKIPGINWSLTKIDL